jgi:hypothetical protein
LLAHVCFCWLMFAFVGLCLLMNIH